MKARVLKAWRCRQHGDICLQSAGEDLRDQIAWHRMLYHGNGPAAGRYSWWIVYKKEA